MPTLSAMGMRMPSLTQRHNYAWQRSHSEKQTGPNTIPSSRVFQGLPDPKGSCREAVKSSAYK